MISTPSRLSWSVTTSVSAPSTFRTLWHIRAHKQEWVIREQHAHKGISHLQDHSHLVRERDSFISASRVIGTWRNPFSRDPVAISAGGLVKSSRLGNPHQNAQHGAVVLCNSSSIRLRVPSRGSVHSFYFSIWVFANDTGPLVCADLPIRPLDWILNSCRLNTELWSNHAKNMRAVIVINRYYFSMGYLIWHTLSWNAGWGLIGWNTPDRLRHSMIYVWGDLDGVCSLKRLVVTVLYCTSP